MSEQYHLINRNNNNVPFLYSASKWRLYALELPQPQPPCSLSALGAFEGINSCWVPIYYTWVERDNCGQNALSKGVRAEWDSNPRPSDCKSRARTTTPQCSHCNVLMVYSSTVYEGNECGKSGDLYIFKLSLLMLLKSIFLKALFYTISQTLIPCIGHAAYLFKVATMLNNLP